MISIIICSRGPEFRLAVAENISATIGVPYEIIAVDNSENTYGICEAYNLGASQSLYGILCFMHEDILFRATDWGKQVVAILADKGIGVLGVAGGLMQLAAPASWWFPGKEYYRTRVLHAIGEREPMLDLVNPTNQELIDVAVLDGLWLCSRKEVWANYPFDSTTFSEFHFYDVDYCTTLFPHYRVCLTFNILIEHSSTGSINKTWINNCIKYYSKWKSTLPFGVVTLDRKEEIKLETDAIYHLIDLLIWYKLPLRTIYRWLGEAIRRSGIERRVFGVCKQIIKHRLS